MKMRYLRAGDHLHDDEEIVVRGGELDPQIVRDDARRMFDIYGVYGISVFALRDATVDELAQLPPLVRFPRLTLVTVGTLRDRGLTVEPTGRNPRHFTLVLPDLATAVDVLVSCESVLWENPYHDA